MRFIVEINRRGQPVMQLQDATREELWFLRRAILANNTTDPYYERKEGADPYWQGSSSDGWLLIEFWGTEAEARAYVSWLNEVYTREVTEAREAGIL